jgi:uncharacterized protein
VITLAFLLAALLPQGPAIPAPRGYVNDFAGVIDAANAARIEQLAQYVRAHSGGEIAVVTIKDIGGRDVGDVALRIGREWKVGAKAAIGDKKRNAGVVVLVIPKETSTDGRGHVSIQVGQGSEGFIPDAVAGDIRREATPYFQRKDYGGALTLITARLAEHYAAEFQFSLDSAGAIPPRRVVPRETPRSDGGGSYIFGALFTLFLFMIVVRAVGGGGRRRRGGLGSALPWIIMSQMGRRGGGGGWGGGGFGGGGGGGFGGFGGGGGFSGGGSSGSW